MFNDGMHNVAYNNIKRDVKILSAKIIGFMWAGWWIFFGLVSAIAEGLPVTKILLHAAIPGFLFLASVIFSYRNPLMGGFVLIIISINAFAVYALMMFGRVGWSSMIIGMVSLTIPPFIAGILFLIGSRSLRLINQKEW